MWPFSFPHAMGESQQVRADERRRRRGSSWAGYKSGVSQVISELQMFSCWLLLMPLTWSLACFQVYKQKVKHLLYEHQENLSELKAEGTLSMKRAQKDHWAQEAELRKEMRSLKVDLKEQELANEVVVKNLRLVGVWWGSADWICVQSTFVSEGSGGSLVCKQETASSGVLARWE